MKLSVRSSLTTGIAAACAGCIALSTSVSPLPDHKVSAAAIYTAPLRAATQPSSPLSMSDVRLLAAVQALRTHGTAPTIAPVPGLTSTADAIDDLYVAIEQWVRYGFEVAADVIAWIPWVGIFANQIMVVYNFVESLINSGVFNTTDWFRGEGSILKNVADWVVDLGLAVVWLGIDEVGAWVPLPPLGWYPPRPPAADLPEGGLGDTVVGASHLLADVSNAIWDVWVPIRGGIDWAVGAASGLLDTVSWIPFVPLIDFEMTEGWSLIAGEIDALTGFAHDMIDAGDQFVTDTLQGDGLIAAIINATSNTFQSIGTRGGEAIQALVDWVNAQIDFFFSPFGATESGADAEKPSASALVSEGSETTVTPAIVPPAQPVEEAAMGNRSKGPVDRRADVVPEGSTHEVTPQPDLENESVDGAEEDSDVEMSSEDEKTPDDDLNREDNLNPEVDGSAVELDGDHPSVDDVATPDSDPAAPVKDDDGADKSDTETSPDGIGAD